MPYYSPDDGLDDTPQANHLLTRCMASGDKMDLHTPVKDLQCMARMPDNMQ